MAVGVFAFPAIFNQASGGQVVATGADVDVVTHRVHRDDAFGFAILRTEHDPRTDGVDRLAQRQRFAVQDHLTPAQTGAAKQAFQQFAASRADQTKQPDNFPGMDFQ